MASSINASTSGAGGLITTADNTGILQLQTAGTNAVTIDASQNATFAGNIIGKQSGLSVPYQYYSLNSAVVGSNATGAQNWLGVGVTLAGSTIYEFEALIALSKSAGTTSHTVALGFGGTATINNIGYNGIPMLSSTSFNPLNNGLQFFLQTASSTVVTSAFTTATNYVWAVLKGIVSINAGGTFIPQYTLSAAPGGAYTTQIGSYFKIAPLAASGSNVNIGTWA